MIFGHWLFDLLHWLKIEAEPGEGNHVVGMMVPTILIGTGIALGLAVGFGLIQVIRTVCRLAEKNRTTR